MTRTFVGNIQGEQMPGGGVDVPRQYRYDKLNRMTGSSEAHLVKTFAYGQYGNRAVTDYSSPGIPPEALYTDKAGLPSTLSDFNTRTNQFRTRPYSDYNASGNNLHLRGA